MKVFQWHAVLLYHKQYKSEFSYWTVVKLSYISCNCVQHGWKEVKHYITIGLVRTFFLNGVCVWLEVLSCPGWESSVVDIVFQIRNLAWWHIPVTALGGWGRRIISLWPACCTVMFCLHKKNKKERKEKKLYLGHLGFLTMTDVAVCGCAPVMEVSLAWWSFTVCI